MYVLRCFNCGKVLGIMFHDFVIECDDPYQNANILCEDCGKEVNFFIATGE